MVYDDKFTVSITITICFNRTRKESLAKAKELWNSSSKTDAISIFQKALKVTFSMVQLLKRLVKNCKQSIILNITCPKIIDILE